MSLAKDIRIQLKDSGLAYWLLSAKSTALLVDGQACAWDGAPHLMLAVVDDNVVPGSSWKAGRGGSLRVPPRYVL